jgi:PKD repeat protein
LTDFVFINRDFQQPRITSTAQAICVGGSIDFSTSTTDAFTYSWTIPGGSITSSTAQNPGTVSFASAGVYNVTLQTTSCCGVSRVDTLQVTVGQPTLTLPADVTLCVNDPKPLLNAGFVQGATYEWFLNGSAIPGATDPTLQTAAAGIYVGRVNYSGGCFASDTFELTLITELPVDLGPDLVLCEGDAPPLLDAGLPGLNYLWTRNGQLVATTRTFQTLQPGRYAVTITNPFGCVGRDTVLIERSLVQVDLGPDVTICGSQSLPLLDAQNPSASHQWLLNGSPAGTGQTLQATGPGTYIVSVVDGLNCISSDTIEIAVVPALNADFNAPLTVLVNTPVSFTDASSPTPSGWIWNFGDNSPSVTAQNPTHTYTEAGTKSVFLIVNEGICADTIVKSIVVELDCSSQPVVADFSISPIEINLNERGSVNLVNTSQNGVSFTWVLPDGRTRSERDQVLALGDTGVFEVKLIVTNFNCSDSITRTVRATQPKDVTGIDQSSFAQNLVLYPNPAKGQVYLRWDGELALPLNIQLMNAVGQEVTRWRIDQTSDSKLELTLDGISPGIYFLRLANSAGMVTQSLEVR